MGQEVSAYSPLVWGVKSSLVSYVRDLHDGEIAVQMPATAVSPAQAAFLGGSEAYAFAPDQASSHYDTIKRTGHLQFRGAVVFSGHFNTMRLEVIDPCLDLRDGAGTLSVCTNGHIGTPRWDAIATAKIISTPGAVQLGITIELALTAAGHLMLGQQYPVGQLLAQATVERVQSFQ